VVADHAAWLAAGSPSDASRRMTGARHNIKPYPLSERPASKINLTDPDSRTLKTPRGWVQRYDDSDLAAAAALAAPHQQRSAAGVQVGLGERERLVDSEPGAPQHDEQAAQPPAMHAVAGAAHDSHDLLDRRRVGGVAHSLLRGGRPAWNSGIVAGERRRPAASSSCSGMTPPRV
jgi:hypothetical protein